jgi:SAM-dependent methyltransferase
MRDRWICLEDNTAQTQFDRHYIYHPAWATRILQELKVQDHVDISSTLHFCSIISAFMNVKFYDYRPANLELSNLVCDSVDLTNLKFETNSILSLSCMHTVEHIGLGRYGDEIDFNGDLKAMKEIARVLAPGGNLLFVVPVGKKSLIQFNAHRIYRPKEIIKIFNSHGLELKQFTLIPESQIDGGLILNPSDDLVSRQSYACGCFWFSK